MRKRRTRKPKPVLQKAVVSLNPQYFDGLPDSLSLVLPTPKTPDACPFIWQKQADSGYYLLFFNVSGWQSMDYMTIFTENGSRFDTVFSIMGESHFKESGEFMAKMGYDIPYERIEKFEYAVFKRFIRVVASSSVYSLLNQTVGDEKPVAFSGSLLWLPKTLRQSVFSTGMFDTEISDHFNFSVN